MKLYKYTPLVIILLTSLACGQFSVGIEQPTPTEEPGNELVTPDLETPEAPEFPPSGPAWLNESDHQTGVSLPAFLSGLTYRDDSVWLVDQYGLTHAVMGQPTNGELSPDGTGYLHSSSMNDGEDILYYNISADSVSQWTDSPLIYEHGYKWWPSRPNTIVFNYIPSEELGPWAGYIGAINISSSEHIVIDGEFGSGTGFDLSPDGERIAYLQVRQPVVYTWGKGTVELDMAAMGLSFEAYLAPRWSPDGSKIAFHAAGGGSDPVTGAILNATVIVDLAVNSAQILHQYQSYGQRGGPELAWSPDGEWLAVVNPGEIDANGDPMAMWLLNPTTQEEVFMGYSSTPLWSPDGEFLVFVTWNPVGSSDPHKVFYTERGSWHPSEITELEGSFLQGWIDLPAE